MPDPEAFEPPAVPLPERGLFDPVDPSVSRALYAEALHDLHGLHGHAVEDPIRDGITSARPEEGHERFQSYISGRIAAEGSPVVREVLERLRREPFVSVADFDPILAAVVQGTVDPRRHHRRLHTRPRCPDRTPRGGSYEVDGSAVEALAAPRVRPCPTCAAHLDPVASWIGRRFRWVRVRNRALTVASDMVSDLPAEPESLWALADVVDRGLGLRTHTAVKVVNTLAAESARRSAVTGDRKGAAFDATVHLVLHEAAQLAGSDSDQADLDTMRELVGEDRGLDDVLDEAARRRSTILKGRVRQRMEEPWQRALDEAARRYGATREVLVEAPGNLAGVADEVPLVRRVVATHGLKMVDLRVTPAVGIAEPVPEPVAQMLVAAKAASRPRWKR